MARIEATQTALFEVPASLEEAYSAFAEPEIVKSSIIGLDRYEILDNGDARWILKEKAEKGLRFRGDYTVRYGGNGADKVNWYTVAGNIDTRGEVVLTRLSSGVRIDYRETLAPDLPIPRLMAKVFKPIVAREVRKDIDAYIENVKRYLTSLR